jgi:FAD/FMN-containing dehydrogenase
VQATYGENYKRLASVKAKYDPRNLFRVNQNIAPAAA